MSIVYLLKNQHEQYLDKAGEWINGENSRTLFRSIHKDEALNHKAELSVKNIDIRISIFEASLNSKGNIELREEELNIDKAPKETVFALEPPESSPDIAPPAESQATEQAVRADEGCEQNDACDEVIVTTLAINTEPQVSEVMKDGEALKATTEDAELEQPNHLQAAH